jgi:hypothetical protein
MAGEYRTSFEFLETVGYTPDFARSRPYQSWSTEVIYVIENQSEYISLQHLIVMFMKDAEGQVQGPYIQKHWRQDWVYEKPTIMEYAGDNSWKHRQLSSAEREGRWAQSVFQVDDSPRYEATGKWQHFTNFSTWLSDTTWRPLPRRESSVRNDYQILEGTNRHTILPTGWVHEEENLKLVLDEHNNPSSDMPYLSKELGVNRYDRITGFDFSAGREYWSESSEFWSNVREVWGQLFLKSEEFSLLTEVNGIPLFVPLFQAADSEEVLTYSQIVEIITPYLTQ